MLVEPVQPIPYLWPISLIPPFFPPKYSLTILRRNSLEYFLGTLNYRVGGRVGAHASGSCSSRNGDRVACTWRWTLHAWLRLLSLEIFAVCAYGVASFCPGWHDLPFLLHPLACHDVVLNVAMRFFVAQLPSSRSCATLTSQRKGE